MKKQVMIKAPWDTEEHGPFEVVNTHGDGQYVIQVGTTSDWHVVAKNWCREISPSFSDEELVIVRLKKIQRGVYHPPIKRFWELTSEDKQFAIPLYLDAPDWKDEAKGDYNSKVIKIANMRFYYRDYVILRNHFTNNTGKTAHPDLLEEYKPIELI